MSQIAVSDRKATLAEIRPHAAAMRRLVLEFGLGRPRLRADGTVIVHSDEPGYRSVMRFSAAASDVVGAYVHVITDDVPGAVTVADL